MTTHTVYQVASENDTEYDGTGFHSEPSTSGKFRHNFDEPGVYFYVSEGHGELGNTVDCTCSYKDF